MKKSKPLSGETSKNSPSKSWYCFSPWWWETLRLTVIFQRSVLVGQSSSTLFAFFIIERGRESQNIGFAGTIWRNSSSAFPPACSCLCHFTEKLTYSTSDDRAGILNLRHAARNWHTAAESVAWAVSLKLASAAHSIDVSREEVCERFSGCQGNSGC